MKIVNPLYDKAFKYLMDNNKFAKKVLSVILDVEIEEVTLGHQETVIPDERRFFTLFRLDFKAVIKEPDGSKKTVLIELQKSKFPTDILRFRNYLGANYMAKRKKEEIIAEPSVEYGAVYPIITIYILGYNLDDLPYMAVTVNREIIDSVSKERIEAKSFFIEHLTHQSHIIQVRRLPNKRQTRLENFLVLFNQAWCTEDNYIIDLQYIPKEFSDMARYLQGPLLDDAFRRQLEGEEEIDAIFDEQAAKHEKKIAEVLSQKEAAEKRAISEQREKEEISKHSKTLAKKLAIQMKRLGASNDEIVAETGLTRDEIEGL